MATFVETKSKTWKAVVRRKGYPTLHQTLLDEHFRVKGRTTWYESVEQMQADHDTCATTTKSALIKAE